MKTPKKRLQNLLPNVKKKGDISENRVGPAISRRKEIRIGIKFNNRFGYPMSTTVTLPDVPLEARLRKKSEKKTVPTFLREKIYRIVGKRRVYFIQDGKKVFLSAGTPEELAAAAEKNESIAFQQRKARVLRVLGKSSRHSQQKLSERECVILEEAAFFRYLVRKKKIKRKAKRIRRALANDRDI